jgi:hypothetical protein
MKLTGKAKEQFEKWYYKKMIYSKWWSEDTFYSLPESMQFGVIQDFADSFGYDIVIIPYGYKMSESFDNDKTYSASIHSEYQWRWDGCDYLTRQEARNAAVEKLNDLINEK